eukprot:c55685_g1_i1 orf=24-176(+)
MTTCVANSTSFASQAPNISSMRGKIHSQACLLLIFSPIGSPRYLVTLASS